MSGLLQARDAAATAAAAQHVVEYETPMAATVCSIILAVVSVTLLSAFFGSLTIAQQHPCPIILT